MPLNLAKTSLQASPTKGEGRLWIVATPIGNPGDLSPRAAKVLTEAAFVLAEDTRRSGQLFARCGISAQKFISLHEHNEEAQLAFVLGELLAGKSAALISDAGMPVLSDPGFRLVKACREAGVEVSVVPGPSAILAALAGSGLAPQPFAFLGFLPRKENEQARIFSQFQPTGCSLVFFERKDRLAQTLQVAHNCLGRREVCIARELTKTYEEFIFGVLGQASQTASSKQVGEGQAFLESVALDEQLSPESDNETANLNANGLNAQSVSKPDNNDPSARPFPPEDLLGEITVVIGPGLPGLNEDRTSEKQLLALASRMKASDPALRPRDRARKLSELVCGWSVKEVYSFLQGE